MRLDRSERHAELLGNFAIGEAVELEFDDLSLWLRQGGYRSLDGLLLLLVVEYLVGTPRTNI